jgi:hypothetical protein
MTELVWAAVDGKVLMALKDFQPDDSIKKQRWLWQAAAVALHNRNTQAFTLILPHLRALPKDQRIQDCTDLLTIAIRTGATAEVEQFILGLAIRVKQAFDGDRVTCAHSIVSEDGLQP